MRLAQDKRPLGAQEAPCAAAAAAAAGGGGLMAKRRAGGGWLRERGWLREL